MKIIIVLLAFLVGLALHYSTEHSNSASSHVIAVR